MRFGFLINFYRAPRYFPEFQNFAMRQECLKSAGVVSSNKLEEQVYCFCWTFPIGLANSLYSSCFCCTLAVMLSLTDVAKVAGCACIIPCSFLSKTENCRMDGRCYQLPLAPFFQFFLGTSSRKAFNEGEETFSTVGP